MAPHGTRWHLGGLAEASASEHRERFRVTVPGPVPEPLQPAGPGMLRRGCAHTGSIARSRTLAVAPIGLLCVGAPERPRHATLGHETHRRPAALRNALQSVFVPVSMLPELRNRPSARFDEGLAFLAVPLVQARRPLVPRHGPLLVPRSHGLHGRTRGFERSEPPFEGAFAQVACDRARLRGEAVLRHEDQPIAPKPQVQAVSGGGCVHLAPTPSATKALGTLALDPADQAFDAAESFAVRRAARRTLGMLAIRRVRHLT